MITIEILINGAGCVKCKRAEAIIDKVLEKHKWKVKVLKTDITKETDKIVECEIMSTPAIIIDGKLEFEGVPNEEDLDKEIRRKL